MYDDDVNFQCHELYFTMLCVRSGSGTMRVLGESFSNSHQNRFKQSSISKEKDILHICRTLLHGKDVLKAAT